MPILSRSGSGPTWCVWRPKSQHKSGYFLVCEDWNAMAVLSVGLAGGFSDDVLPSVEEVRASWTVGYNEVRLIRFHALEFLVRIGQ